MTFAGICPFCYTAWPYPEVNAIYAMYQCPLCQLPLVFEPNTAATSHAASYRCSNRHQFDCAKEGYVNLLPVQHKKSREPGDNLAMMQARRQFLEAGHYQPLASNILQLFSEKLAKDAVILDIGCGEGWYTQQLSHLSANVYGLDISKVAVRYAAKKYPSLQCCVASSYQLPYQDASVDAVLRIYAPSLSAELARVLKVDGLLLTVTPAPHHLYELKAKVYSEVRLHSDAVIEESGLQHCHRQRLQWQWQAPDAATLTLLMDMIPLSYRLTSQMRTELCQKLPTLTLDFYLDLYQKTTPSI